MKEYGTTKGLFDLPESKPMRAFPFLKGFQSKPYASKSYNAASYWGGDFKFKTADASLGSHGFLDNLIHLFRTKPADTKTSWMANKGFATKDAQAATMVSENSKNKFRGKLQDRLEKEGPNALAGSDPLRESEGATVQTTCGGRRAASAGLRRVDACDVERRYPRDARGRREVGARFSKARAF